MKYSILINSCDDYNDCWDPFFKLFKKYWPDCSGHLYLNTEFISYEYPSLNITSTKLGIIHKYDPQVQPSWSKRLRWALESIDSDIVLFLQEDFFLKEMVNNQQIEKFVDLMTTYGEIACIHITTNEKATTNKISPYPGLSVALLHYMYRVSCQPALWRKKELLNILRDYETGWEFELIGSKRSALMGKDYYYLENIEKNNKIFPYIKTGITKAQWNKEVIPVFAENNIYMDYNKRGFWCDDDAKESSYIENATKRTRFRNITLKIIRKLDDIYLKIKYKRR